MQIELLDAVFAGADVDLCTLKVVRLTNLFMTPSGAMQGRPNPY